MQSAYSISDSLVRQIFVRAAGQCDLLYFARYVDRDFQSPAHIKMIADKLTAVKEGSCKRLIINMPPRHGKSHLTSKIFPAWYIGNNPKAQFIIASYAATLATEFSRWIRNTTKDQYYQDIFDVKLKDDSQAADRWETSEGGVMVGAGVGGAITGRGADIALIDDPVKNYEEAISETVQEKVWDWFNSTLRTRLHPGGSIILIMTRWTENDLAGKLLKHEPDKWEVLKLPAISERNEALWPDRYSLSDLREIERTTTTKIFSALYQQEPVDVTERIFTDPKYCRVPEGLPLIAYIDPAMGGDDYTALTIGTISEGKIYIVAGYCWKKQIDETYDIAEYLCNGFNVRTLIVEANQAQIAIAYEFNRRGLNVKTVYQFKNKHFRIVHFGKRYWDHIYFNDEMLNTDDGREYMEQLLTYSELSKHDDVPDSLSGLVQYFVGAGQ